MTEESNETDEEKVEEEDEEDDKEEGDDEDVEAEKNKWNDSFTNKLIFVRRGK